MKDNHNHNRKTLYVSDALLAEVKEECDLYGISFSKAIQDAWTIARDCKCPLPKGVAIFGRKNRKR